MTKLNRRDWLVGSAAAALATQAPGGAIAKNASRTVELDVRQASRPIDRFFDLSVGADFPGTTMRDANLEQMATSVNELGFRYTRLHNIFADDLGTVKMVDNKLVYDWTKIDYLYDRLLKIGIRPFVELGFTPDVMKTSDQTIFYWKGNTSPPRLDLWKQLIDAFTRHMIERHGIDEVSSWYFEIWNEPNLKDFWQYADQEAYFALYGVSARTLKSIDSRLRVGGPSTAGAGLGAGIPSLYKSNKYARRFCDHAYLWRTRRLFGRAGTAGHQA